MAWKNISSIDQIYEEEVLCQPEEVEEEVIEDWPVEVSSGEEQYDEEDEELVLPGCSIQTTLLRGFFKKNDIVTLQMKITEHAKARTRLSKLLRSRS